MEKCAICGKETNELYECDTCGRLICADCGGEVFHCHECFEREYDYYHGIFGTQDNNGENRIV